MSTVGPGPYQPPQYAMAQPPAPRRGNGWGLAALITGIVAVVFAAIPFVCFLAFLIAIAAIALGIVGLVVKNRPRGTAITSLILGAVAFLLAIVMSFVTVGIVQNIAQAAEEGFSSLVPTDFPSDPSAGGTDPVDPEELADEFSLAPGDHEVVFEVEGGGEAIVTAYAYAGGQTGSSRDTRTLPYENTQQFTSTEDDPFASFSLTVIQAGAQEPLTCTISVDGEVVTTNTSDSTFVLCLAQSGS